MPLHCTTKAQKEKNAIVINALAREKGLGKVVDKRKLSVIPDNLLEKLKEELLGDNS